jgi:hypothetical protein
MIKAREYNNNPIIINKMNAEYYLNQGLKKREKDTYLSKTE